MASQVFRVKRTMQHFEEGSDVGAEDLVKKGHDIDWLIERGTIAPKSAGGIPLMAAGEGEYVPGPDDDFPAAIAEINRLRALIEQERETAKAAVEAANALAKGRGEKLVEAMGKAAEQERRAVDAESKLAALQTEYENFKASVAASTPPADDTDKGGKKKKT